MKHFNPNYELDKLKMENFEKKKGKNISLVNLFRWAKIMELSPYSLLYIMRTTLVVPYPKKATTFDGGGKSKIVCHATRTCVN